MKKIIKNIFNKNKEIPRRIKKDQVSVAKSGNMKEFAKKEQKASEIVSARFGRALERLGER